MKRYLIILLGLFLILSCAKKEDAKTKTTYLAKVGNATITEADLDRELKSIPPFAQQLFAGSEGKQKFLEELIKKELLYQEALKKGLDKDHEYKSRVEDFKKITLVGKLLEKEIEAKSNVTMEDVQNYYNKNKDEFSEIKQIRMSQILVKTDDEAQKILDRLKKGETFATVAKSASIDTNSAKNGGDLGYLSLQQIAPDIRNTAMRLKVGEISNPIKTPSGIHIIMITDKKLGKQAEFEKVKNAIFQRLTAQKQREAFDNYIENLKKNYKVEINKEALAKLSSTEPKEQGLIINPPQQPQSKTQKSGEGKK